VPAGNALFDGQNNICWPISLVEMRKFLRLARLPASRRRRAIARLASSVLIDERGGEVLEYALVAGLMVTGAIGVIGCVGTKVVARWTSLNDSL
jgi:Flp pilus assembly pilin Flp